MYQLTASFIVFAAITLLVKVKSWDYPRLEYWKNELSCVMANNSFFPMNRLNKSSAFLKCIIDSGCNNVTWSYEGNSSNQTNESDNSNQTNESGLTFQAATGSQGCYLNYTDSSGLFKCTENEDEGRYLYVYIGSKDINYNGVC